MTDECPFRPARKTLQLTQLCPTKFAMSMNTVLSILSTPTTVYPAQQAAPTTLDPNAVLLVLGLAAIVLVGFLIVRNRNVSAEAKLGDVFQGKLTTSDSAAAGGVEPPAGDAPETATPTGPRASMNVGNVAGSTLSNAAAQGNAELAAKDITNSKVENRSGGGSSDLRAGDINDSTVINVTGGAPIIHMPGAGAHSGSPTAAGLDRRLRDALANNFTLDDLDVLLDDLGVKADEIPRKSLENRALAIVRYFDHRGRLPELAAAITKRRNNLRFD